MERGWKTFTKEETYEGRNVLSQYDRSDSSRGADIFFLFHKRVYQNGIFPAI